MEPGSLQSVVIQIHETGIFSRPALFCALDPVRNALALKITFLGNVIQTAEFRTVRIPQNLHHLFRGEHIVFPFHAFTVGILTTIAAAFPVCQFPDDIPGCSVGNIRKCFLLRVLVGFYIGHQKQGIVIEHLLKMGHQPHFIRGIPGKASSDVIVNTASGHILQSQLGHFHGTVFPHDCAIAHQEEQIMGSRKLRSVAETAPFHIKDPGKLRECTICQFAAWFSARLGFTLIDGCGDVISCLNQLIPVCIPESCSPFQQLRQTHSAVGTLLREVGSGKERLLIRCQKHRQWPAAGAGDSLTDGHIHRIDIRPFFPVNLD